MTKGQWNNLKIGSRVTTASPNIKDSGYTVFHGTVIRANSNWSQVYVEWDNVNAGNWYGRMGIEIANDLPNGFEKAEGSVAKKY